MSWRSFQCNRRTDGVCGGISVRCSSTITWPNATHEYSLCAWFGLPQTEQLQMRSRCTERAVQSTPLTKRTATPLLPHAHPSTPS
jgi:hypothetical protein